LIVIERLQAVKAFDEMAEARAGITFELTGDDGGTLLAFGLSEGLGVP
jgi:hypothetical protein